MLPMMPPSPTPTPQTHPHPASAQDDQTIYSFIGAVPNIFSSFCKHFDAHLLCLQINFRWQEGGAVAARIEKRTWLYAPVVCDRSVFSGPGIKGFPSPSPRRRSSPTICAFGSSVLLGNRGRSTHKAMLPARHGPCAPVCVRQFASAALEAEALASQVDRLWRQEGVPLRRMAALFRCLRLQGAAPHAPLMAALRR